MSKHTPGPWRKIHHMIMVDVGPYKAGKVIASMLQAVPSDEDVANVHLIAAAPELLEALQDLYKFFTPQSQEESDICVKVETAIAKALNQPITE